LECSTELKKQAWRRKGMKWPFSPLQDSVLVSAISVARLLLKPVDTKAEESRWAVHFNIDRWDLKGTCLFFSVFILD
jgi:hypothetical protein